MIVITTLPKGEKAREIDSLALHEIVETGYRFSAHRPSYFKSKRGGYVYVTYPAMERITEFANKIKAASEREKYDLKEALTHGCFMLWRHANEKDKNREMFFQFKSHPAVELSILVEHLRLP